MAENGTNGMLLAGNGAEEHVESEKKGLPEELNDFNTDLKELFMQMEYEEMKNRMCAYDPEKMVQIIVYNHEVVDTYFRSGRMDLIRKFISFVAFASFLTEVGCQLKLLTDGAERMELFQDIFEALQSGNGDQNGD